MSKSDLTDDDLLDVYDLVWSQTKEDREIVMEAYKNLHSLVKDNPERFAVSGDTLVKFADLLTKQTGQIIEIMKILRKDKKSDDEFTPEDLEAIKNSIE